jgi:hypothetical protein
MRFYPGLSDPHVNDLQSEGHFLLLYGTPYRLQGISAEEYESSLVVRVVRVVRLVMLDT